VCEHTFVRWQSQSVDAEHDPRLPGFSEDVVIRRFNAPEALETRFHEVRTKSAINRVPAASRVPFEWTVNPYRGCAHACTFCFARPTHEYLDFNAGRDFEKEIIVKVNVPEVLRAELARPSWGGHHIAMGTNTDPYQWVEGRYKLMRGIWEAMRDFSNPCSILTKSPLLLRDADLLCQIAERTHVSACFSVPTLDEKVWRQTEPHTPNPRARLEAVGELNRLGIPTGILIAPLMPGINDAPEQVEKIVALATEAGAVHIGGITLWLRGSVKEVFFDYLREYRPDLLERYTKLYARGAYVPADERRTIERAAGAPWANRSRPERSAHRGGNRIGRPRREPPRSEEVTPTTQGSLF
jgi:DNA repair photolyase